MTDVGKRIDDAIAKVRRMAANHPYRIEIGKLIIKWNSLKKLLVDDQALKDLEAEIEAILKSLEAESSDPSAADDVKAKVDSLLPKNAKSAESERSVSGTSLK